MKLDTVDFLVLFRNGDVVHELVLDNGTVQIIVSCKCPEGAEADYGYLTLKGTMKEAFESIGADPGDLIWTYESGRRFTADAHEAVDVDVHISACDREAGEWM